MKIKTKALNELNRLGRQMIGKPMTKEQLHLQNELRMKVKNKELTYKECQEIWDKKYGR